MLPINRHCLFQLRESVKLSASDHADDHHRRNDQQYQPDGKRAQIARHRNLFPHRAIVPLFQNPGTPCHHGERRQPMKAILSFTLVLGSAVLFVSGAASAGDDPAAVLLAAEEPPAQGGDIQERRLVRPTLGPQSQINPTILAAAAANASQEAAELDPKAMSARIKMLEKVISCMLVLDHGVFKDLTSILQVHGANVVWSYETCD
jgi:hypothetical protein